MTFYYGTASTRNLQTCHRDIQATMNLAIYISDVDMSAVCGKRGEVAQEKAFDDGFSKAHFGESPHNFVVKDDGGCPACDMIPWKDGKGQWNDKALFHRMADFIMEANKQLLGWGIVKHELVWGNDWNGNGIIVENDPAENFIDRPHWQLKEWRKLV